MNLDELIKKVIHFDGALQNQSSSSSSGPLASSRDDHDQRRREKKAMDGMWGEIMSTEDPTAMINAGGNDRRIGENAMEDFLARMGVIDQDDAEHSEIDPTALVSQPQGVEGGDLAGERKRKCTEEVVERKQKRMIKNRESAARSRARKQAYTNQLEIAVRQEKERNTLLKKHKEIEKILFPDWSMEIRYQLRRTSSAHF